MQRNEEKCGEKHWNETKSRKMQWNGKMVNGEYS